MTTAAVLAIAIVAYAVVAERLRTTVLTGPILFTGLGLALGAAGAGLLEVPLESEGIMLLAEATLALILFTDAARIDLRRLRSSAGLPLRMLATIPVVVALGTLAGVALLPGVGLMAAAVLAAVLTPTDAALGQAVVHDERMPVRIRQTLNVESGLNDGLALPLVTILAGLAAGTATSDPGDAVVLVVRQVGLGLVGGLVIGFGGALLVDRATAAGWIGTTSTRIATLAIAVGCVAVTDLIGGNGLVAAFVGGLCYGSTSGRRCAEVYAFAEEEGQLLTLLVFTILGATVVPDAIIPLDGHIVAYVAASLTVVRMLPIALSLIGAGLQGRTIALLGWFGPRGLATVLFVLLVVEELDPGDAETVLGVALWTVLASLLLHGVSAVPLVGRYAAWIAAADQEMAEEEDMVEFPTGRA